MKFAMYGSGAAGSVFASYLRKGGADIILIDRYEAHMKKVAEEGMHFTRTWSPMCFIIPICWVT